MTTRRQRGTSLLEMLVACAVLAAGVVAALRLHTDMRRHADHARLRHEALRLAQQDLERLRGGAALADADTTVDGDGGVRFTLARRVASEGVPDLVAVRHTVAWTDRAGTAASVRLDAQLDTRSPTASGALLVDAGRSAAQRPLGRSPRIPVAAKDLGDGRSALKPSTAGNVAFVFDNGSGALVASCTGLATGLGTRQLAATALGTCSDRSTRYIAGELRWSATLPPMPGESTTVPLPFAIDVAAPEPAVCTTELRKTVRVVREGSLRVEALPLDAALPVGGIDTGERHAAWACAVEAGAGTVPSVLPIGWTIGSAAADRRVCRYAGGHLLVVPGPAACPGAPPVTITGSADDVFADLSTSP